MKINAFSHDCASFPSHHFFFQNKITKIIIKSFPLENDHLENIGQQQINAYTCAHKQRGETAMHALCLIQLKMLGTNDV